MRVRFIILLIALLTLTGMGSVPGRTPTAAEIESAIAKRRVELAGEPEWFSNAYKFQWQATYKANDVEIGSDGKTYLKPSVVAYEGLHPISVVYLLAIGLLSVAVGWINSREINFFFRGMYFAAYTLFGIFLGSVIVLISGGAGFLLSSVFGVWGYDVSINFIFALGVPTILLFGLVCLIGFSLFAGWRRAWPALIRVCLDSTFKFREASHRRVTTRRIAAEQSRISSQKLRDTLNSLASYADLLGRDPEKEEDRLVRVGQLVGDLLQINPTDADRDLIRGDIILVLQRLKSTGHQHTIAYERLNRIINHR
jgi:hypothetical protein